MLPTSYSEEDLNSILALQKNADMAYEQADWQQAEKDYSQLTEKIPNNPEPWYRLGNVYAELNKSDNAITAYRRAIEINPDNTKAWHNLGLVQLQQATRTFIDMQEHATKDDIMAQRGRFVVNSIQQILEQGFGVSIEAENSTDDVPQ